MDNVEIFYESSDVEKEDMLSKIFEIRENELAEINNKDKEFLKREQIDLNETYKELLDIIENIPLNEKEKVKLIEKIDEYIEINNYRNSYFNEKYYKEGFKDGLQLKIECNK